jgi:hypothetical protein
VKEIAMHVVQKIVRGAGYLVAGLLIGTLLFLIGTPAFAQDPGSGSGWSPNLGSRAGLVIRADRVQWITASGAEAFAIADDGTVELSGGATIDYAVTMRGPPPAALAGTVLIRVGGALYVMPYYQAGADSQVPR